MAKRKRLGPANPGFFTETAAPVLRAPIADVAREAAGVAAAEELAAELTAARAEGRMVVRIPLEAVALDYLVRDRIAAQDDEMAALKASLLARGQQVPVELVDLGDGRYGLISGWRRMKALTALQAETGQDRFATVLGLIRQPAEQAEAYLAMVEENEIRVGLSYVERARIVAKSVEQGVFETDRAALQALFGAASRAKRSKIGSFLPVVRALGDALRFPTALGERLGLQLGRALDADPDLGTRLATALAAADPKTPADEATVLDRALAPPPDPKTPANAAPPALPRPITVGGGVSLAEDAQGRLILSGRGVDAALKARLVAWLRTG